MDIATATAAAAVPGIRCDVAADWAPTTGSGVARTFQIAAANQLLLRDFFAAVVVAAAAAAWVDAWRRLQQRGVLSSVVTRKVLHMTTGPMFVACWPLFSNHPYSRALASLVLVAQLVRLTLRGGDTATSPSLPNNHRSLAASIARNGSEQLRGPVTYVSVLFVITMLLWRSSVPALVAVGQLAGGDAAAEIVGTRVPSWKWRWSRTHKSLAGSLGFVAGGFCMSLCLLLYFRRLRLIAIDVRSMLPRLLLVSVISAAAELLPFGDDNLWVPLAAACATKFLVSFRSFGSSPNRAPTFNNF